MSWWPNISEVKLILMIGLSLFADNKLLIKLVTIGEDSLSIIMSLDED